MAKKKFKVFGIALILSTMIAGFVCAEERTYDVTVLYTRYGSHREKTYSVVAASAGEAEDKAKARCISEDGGTVLYCKSPLARGFVD
jgi:hypothetical protein